MYMYVENSLAKIPKSLLRNGNGLDEQLYCFTEPKSDNANGAFAMKSILFCHLEVVKHSTFVDFLQNS